jgi:hypothetical protein
MTFTSAALQEIAFGQAQAIIRDAIAHNARFDTGWLYSKITLYCRHRQAGVLGKKIVVLRDTDWPEVERAIRYIAELRAEMKRARAA